MSFLTVTYWNDFELLTQQLDSLNKHFTPGYTHYIVLNDHVKHLDELQVIVSQYTQHNYHIIHRDKIFAQHDCIPPQSGWWTQQILKLLSYSVVGTEFYCVLDSKNVLLSKMDESTFVKNGQPVMVVEGEYNTKGEFSKYYAHSYKFLEVDQNDSTLGQALTPSVLKCNWVKNLIEYIKLQGHTVEEALSGNPKNMCVEFYLYSAWLTKQKLTDQIFWYPGDFWTTIGRSKNLRRL